MGDAAPGPFFRTEPGSHEPCEKTRRTRNPNGEIARYTRATGCSAVRSWDVGDRRYKRGGLGEVAKPEVSRSR